MTRTSRRGGVKWVYFELGSFKTQEKTGDRYGLALVESVRARGEGKGTKGMIPEKTWETLNWKTKKRGIWVKKEGKTQNDQMVLMG